MLKYLNGNQNNFQKKLELVLGKRKIIQKNKLNKVKPIIENVKKNGSYFFPMLFTIFSFIFFCNLLGMIPYSFTVTSHIVITLGLAAMAFISINIVGVKTHGIHLLSLFLPSGAPIALAPLLVMIELVSYSFRVVSLALRLFANMMSGHCLLKILAGFA